MNAVDMQRFVMPAVSGQKSKYKRPETSLCNILWVYFTNDVRTLSAKKVLGNCPVSTYEYDFGLLGIFTFHWYI